MADVFIAVCEIASPYHVINLGIKHHKIWMFYIQSKYLHSYLTKLKQIPPVVHLLPMKIVKKQEELPIYFRISQGHINNRTHLYSVC